MKKSSTLAKRFYPFPIKDFLPDNVLALPLNFYGIVTILHLALATVIWGNASTLVLRIKSYPPIASCGKDIPCSAQNQINDTALHLY